MRAACCINNTLRTRTRSLLELLLRKQQQQQQWRSTVPPQKISKKQQLRGSSSFHQPPPLSYHGSSTPLLQQRIRAAKGRVRPGWAPDRWRRNGYATSNRGTAGASCHDSTPSLQQRICAANGRVRPGWAPDRWRRNGCATSNRGTAGGSCHDSTPSLQQRIRAAKGRVRLGWAPDRWRRNGYATSNRGTAGGSCHDSTPPLQQRIRAAKAHVRPGWAPDRCRRNGYTDSNRGTAGGSCHDSTPLLQQRIRAAKGRVRPDWDPDRWSRNGYAAQRVSGSSWPAPRRADGVRDLPPVEVIMEPDGLITAATTIDLTRPARFGQDLSTAWPRAEAFALDSLWHSCGDVAVCVGSDDDTGGEITLALRDYLAYAARDAHGDDSPLYAFDDRILLQREDGLARAYAVPGCFPHDFMSLLPDDERPPHAWLLVGAARSGTALHADPLATAAWNTLVCGRKRWFLFPPPTAAAGDDDVDDVDDYLSEMMNATTATAADINSENSSMPSSIPTDSAVHWLMEVYPHLPAARLEGGRDFVQRPGETVYVPPGWRHAVVNLEMTVAVTHNFVGPHNARAALAAMRRDGDDEHDGDDDDNDSEITSSSSLAAMADAWEEKLRERGWLE